jgi:hypothetical protein
LTTSSTPLFDEPPPNAFSIPDDTQVYFTDSDLKFFAFVIQEKKKEKKKEYDSLY